MSFSLNGIYRGKVLQHLTHGYCKIWIPGIYPDEWKSQPSKIPPAEQASSLFAGTNNGNGVFTYPNIGSSVWCLFANGDQNLPVYFAAALGGENAYGQHDIVLDDKHLVIESEDNHGNIISDEVDFKLSDKHLVTAGKARVEFFENGKISAIVEDPIRTDAKVDFKEDLVIERPICEQVADEELSNIDCQIVMDNNSAKGTISCSTHLYNFDDQMSAIFLSDEQTTIVSTLNIEDRCDHQIVQDNCGITQSDTISSYSNMYTKNTTVIPTKEMTQELSTLDTDSQTSHMHNINGRYGFNYTSAFNETTSYAYMNADRKIVKTEFQKDVNETSNCLDVKSANRFNSQSDTEYDHTYIYAYANPDEAIVEQKLNTFEKNSNNQILYDDQMRINIITQQDIDQLDEYVILRTDQQEQKFKTLETSQKNGMTFNGKHCYDIGTQQQSELFDQEAKGPALEYVTIHTNKHKTNSALSANSESSLSIGNSYFDDDEVQTFKAGTLIDDIQKKVDNQSFIDAHTFKKAKMTLKTKEKSSIKLFSGAEKKFDTECIQNMLASDGQIEIRITNNVDHQECSIIMTNKGVININASSSINFSAPKITMTGTQYDAKFNKYNLKSEKLNIVGTGGDCMIGNVSLVNHAHQETQVGDVVQPQATMTAKQSN